MAGRLTIFHTEKYGCEKVQGTKKKSFILQELDQAGIGDHTISSKRKQKEVKSHQKILKKKMVGSDELSDNLDMESDGKEELDCDS